ncbi:uncharacterized protein [Chironomus tepperi]|uniref:uncharacterized protein isoform X2 n=1 Tax=Chironomus tepperi TaxID=113505 RepID=UPI00391F3792
MWKFLAVLIVTILCVHAEEEQPKTGPQSSSLVEVALCYVTPKPLNCLKEQTGRMLDYYEGKVEEKRQELMDEADKEMKESETSRGLSDDEKKERPSEIMNALEKGFSAIANIVTDEVDNLRGRNGRALDKTDKKQLDDDDANDFNDDFSIYDTLRTEGNITKDEEGRAKGLTKGYKGNKKQGYGYDDERDGWSYGGYGKGKKGKKGKKGMMKLFFLGAIIKSKIEMLLKILSFHLQIKFFAIALINMIINLARFWIDLKRQPQKHHYDEHDDWGSSWKRTQGQPEYQGQDFAHRLAYGSSAYPGHTGQQY